LIDIGSWRGAAGFLADQLNGQMGLVQYSYVDFYMGTFARGFDVYLLDDLSPTESLWV
jgi:hypothetical protein